VPDSRAFVASTVGLGLVAMAHAALTWPPRAAVALFAGGAAVAFGAEAVAIRLGWLEHHVDPQILGVPLYALFGWTGLIYVAFRAALLVTDGPTAVVAGAALAAGYDALIDHRGVEEGLVVLKINDVKIILRLSSSSLIYETNPNSKVIDFGCRPSPSRTRHFAHSLDFNWWAHYTGLAEY
jgi:hypothetical protein